MFHVVSPSGSEGGKHHMNESWTLNPNIHHILNYGRAIFNHHQNLWDQLHIPVYVNALIIKTCIYCYYFGKRVSVVISLFAHHLEKKTNNSWKLLNVSEVCSRKCSVFLGAQTKFSPSRFYWCGRRSFQGGMTWNLGTKKQNCLLTFYHAVLFVKYIFLLCGQTQTLTWDTQKNLFGWCRQTMWMSAQCYGFQ